MKKHLATSALLICIAFLSNAQNLISKIPQSASIVVKYAGENFTKNISVQKIDSYHFIKNDFFKMLHIDTLTSIQNLGVNFEQDAYQYITNEDTSLNFVTLLPLKNKEQFLRTLKSKYNSAGKFEKKNGYDFYTVSPETYVGFTETTAVIVNSTYQNRRSYYDYLYPSYNTESDSVKVIEVAPVEETVPVMDMPAADTVKFTPPKIVKDKIKKGQQPVKKKPTATKPTAKGKTKPKPKTQRAPMEEVMEDAVISTRKYGNPYNDSIENRKRELWQEQQDMIARKKQLAVAETIITATLNNNIKSVENQVNYTKIVDPAAHASIWIKNENIFNQYKNYFSMGSYFYNYGGYRNRYYTDTTDGFNSAINIFFEKDKMRMNQKTFSTNAELAQLGTAVMNSKQNTALLNYINPDNIGYFSMSINTEAMANYYYTFLKKYMNSTPYMNEYSDAINVYIDLLEILIDEKGIADLMPGNYLFVMHDMKNKLVTYTDYDYDKEFNKKEIKKTKNELSPNFTFVMETKKEAFMKKVANLPLKYAKKEGYNYKDKGGYYELAFKDGEMPISSLYFMIKDGKGIVSTSMDVITSTLNNTALYAPSEEAKNSILSNNYSLNINSKKLLEKIGPELSSNANKKVNDYLLENFGDIKMESSLKDGIIQGTTTVNIKGNHANSLEFLFNMMDAINTIMEKERQEEAKKIN